MKEVILTVPKILIARQHYLLLLQKKNYEKILPYDVINYTYILKSTKQILLILYFTVQIL